MVYLVNLFYETGPWSLNDYITFNHLADAFIQSDVQMRRTIEAIFVNFRNKIYIYLNAMFPKHVFGGPPTMHILYFGCLKKVCSVEGSPGPGNHYINVM